jgi:dihydrofolate reductase
LKHFSTQTKKVKDPTKRNAVIYGRISYFGVPDDKRPLRNRLNVVLTTQPENYQFPAEVITANSLTQALEKLQDPKISSEIENVWILGGSAVYKESMASPHCHKVYLTRIMHEFECDTFFPEIPKDFKRVPNDPDISEEIQEENGVKYQFQTYEKIQA